MAVVIAVAVVAAAQAGAAAAVPLADPALAPLGRLGQRATHRAGAGGDPPVCAAPGATGSARATKGHCRHSAGLRIAASRIAYLGIGRLARPWEGEAPAEENQKHAVKFSLDFGASPYGGRWLNSRRCGQTRSGSAVASPFPQDEGNGR